MRNLDAIDAETLLSVRSPESLFSPKSEEMKIEYRVLARRWHPDLHSKTTLEAGVFAHIARLYKEARKKLADGSWYEPVEKVEQESPGRKKFRKKDGSILVVPYTVSRSFELGTMLIGSDTVAFEVDEQFSDLFGNGLSWMTALRFPDLDMAAEMSRYLPQTIDSFDTSHSSILIVRKTPDQLLLSDVLRHSKGRIKPLQHLGWILNVLYNLGCYLEWHGIAHNGISIDSLFISPLRHSGMLLGGWWYSTLVDSTITALPDSCLDHIPHDILVSKIAAVRGDLELIKAVGRQLLGDITGAQLLLDDTLPGPLVEWLTMPASDSAREDYATFKDVVLPAVFGPPRFVSWRLESKHLYKTVK